MVVSQSPEYSVFACGSCQLTSECQRRIDACVRGQATDFCGCLVLDNIKTSFVHEGVETIDELLDFLLLAGGALIEASQLLGRRFGCLSLGLTLIDLYFLLSGPANGSLELATKLIAKRRLDVRCSVERFEAEFQVLFGPTGVFKHRTAWRRSAWFRLPPAVCRP